MAETVPSATMWMGLLQLAITLAIPLSLEFRAVTRSWSYRWPWTSLSQIVNLVLAAIACLFLLNAALVGMTTDRPFRVESWMNYCLGIAFATVVVTPVIPPAFGFLSVAFAGWVYIPGHTGQVLRLARKSGRNLDKGLSAARRGFHKLHELYTRLHDVAEQSDDSLRQLTGHSRGFAIELSPRLAERVRATRSSDLSSYALAIHGAEVGIAIFRMEIREIRRAARHYVAVSNEHRRLFALDPEAADAFESERAAAYEAYAARSSSGLQYLHEAMGLVADLATHAPGVARRFENLMQQTRDEGQAAMAAAACGMFAAAER